MLRFRQLEALKGNQYFHFLLSAATLQPALKYST